MDDKYKSVLVVNNTDDKQITLHTYLNKDPICWRSWSSKIIPAGEKYLYRSDSRFQYSLIATDANKEKSTVLSVQKWTADKHYAVSNSLEVTESDLEKHLGEKKICIRRINKDKETDGGKNLYELLRLNMADVRKKKIEEQNEMIEEAFRREIRRWLPDRQADSAYGQDAREIIDAYYMLEDPERRATYHNMADYDSGWISKRWKAVFLTECHTEEQKKNYRRRLIQIALSVGFVVGGIVLSAVTAGVSEVLAVIVAGGVVGGALTEAGTFGCQRTMKRRSVRDGCKWKEFFRSAAIGGASGAATGAFTGGKGASVIKMLKSILKTDFNAGGKLIANLLGTNLEKKVVESIASNFVKKGAELLDDLLDDLEIQLPTIEDSDNLECEIDDELEIRNGRIRYISEGPWMSKMIVQYKIQGVTVTNKVRGSGSAVEIPADAQDITVRFQVMRFLGTWCDIKKYDRTNQSWIKPKVPHIFRYNRPPIRTFTLSGSLYYEAVMNITDENYDELEEM